MLKHTQAPYGGILRDLSIIILSVLVAMLLVRTNVIDDALASTQERGHVGSFVAGMFFTSIFTTAPAIVTLGEISQRQGVIETAIWAALGSVVGDMLIFRFVKDKMAAHLGELLSHR